MSFRKLPRAARFRFVFQITISNIARTIFRLLFVLSIFKSYFKIGYFSYSWSVIFRTVLFKTHTSSIFRLRFFLFFFWEATKNFQTYTRPIKMFLSVPKYSLAKWLTYVRYLLRPDDGGIAFLLHKFVCLVFRDWIWITHTHAHRGSSWTQPSLKPTYIYTYNNTRQLFFLALFWQSAL